MPAGQRGPLSTRGTAVRRWRGSSWNLLLDVKDLRDNPSVKPTACQLSTRHALRVPYRGAYTQKGSLNEKASLEKGGGPAKLVEGYFVNLFPVVSDSTEVPLSHLR